MVKSKRSKDLEMNRDSRPNTRLSIIKKKVRK